jgi:pimeloyl-ACP methyl ester carboxylesterase
MTAVSAGRSSTRAPDADKHHYRFDHEHREVVGSRLGLVMPVVTVLGSPVRYDRVGDGPVLVLLHGGGLDSAQVSWGPLTPGLVADADVICPDLPGYGGSPLGTTSATVAGYADWLSAFLDAVGVSRCVLGGLSLGGAIALQMAIDDPARVAGLVLCGPYGVDPRIPGGRLGWLSVQTPGLDAMTWWTMRHSRRAVRATLGTLLRHGVSDELVDEVQTLARTPGAGVAWRAFQQHEVLFSGPRTVFGDALAGIHCRALLLAGEYDIVPPAAVRAAAARIPGGEFEVVPGAGHWLPRDAPEAVAKRLLEMVTGTAQRPS